MAKKKNYYYVVVLGEECRLAMVTKIDNEKRVAEWKMKKENKPYCFHSLKDAQYVCMGLLWRGTWAYPVSMNYELEQLPYYESDEEEKKE